MREIELFLEGQEDRWLRLMELMGWMTVHLMNIHIPKGKKTVALADLMPESWQKKRGKKAPPIGTDEFKQFMRDRQEALDQEKYWRSPEGKRVREFLKSSGYEEGEEETEE